MAKFSVYLNRPVFVMEQGLHSSLTESLDTTEYMNGEQRPDGTMCMHMDDLNLCIFHMFEGTFSLDMAHP